MFRFEGASELIRESVPPMVREGFAIVTLLGDLAFIFALLALLYWLEDRESTATVIAYALVGLAVTLVLKEWFGLPRPPGAVQAVSTDPDSYGFPSGHAIAATVVYGGLLVTRERLHDIRAALSTAGIVFLVGISRVVIGVHYLGDVVVGFAIGGVVLGSLWYGVGHRPAVASLLAGVIAVPAVLLTGIGHDAILALSGSLGGALAFSRVDLDSVPTPSGAAARVGLVGLGFGVVGGLYWVAETTSATPVAFLAGVGLVATVILLPAVLRWKRIGASS